MIDRAGAVTQAGIGANRLRDEAFGEGDGIGEGQAMGQTGGDRRGIGTAGSMGVGSIEAFAGELVEGAVLGQEEIEGNALEVSTLDEYRAGTQVTDIEGRLAHGLG